MTEKSFGEMIDASKDQVVEREYMTAYDEILQRGEAQGIEKGMQKGMPAAYAQIVRNMSQNGMDSETIARHVSIPVSQIEQILAESSE